MSDDVYCRLAKVLDTLPNGFPSTEDGLEIKLLKKIFRPEDAELFCDLRLSFETADQISKRTGRPLEGLEAHLTEMWNRGQVFGVELGGIKIFKMVPWAFGIYEFQLHRMDRELAELCEAYGKVYGPQFFKDAPQLMQVVPVEDKIEARHEALPYEKVSAIIENGKSFLVQDCICKKEQGLLDSPCDRPLEVCLAIAPIEGVFENSTHGRILSKLEAYDLLQKCEEDALVHLTWNVENRHFFICNCCGCCCGVLRSINEWGILNAVNSYYLAEIDPDECTACGTCADERCQVNAIEEGEEFYRVIAERCIGCGLCVTTCPSEAIQLVRKPAEQLVTPPKDEMDWYERRGKLRGVDFSQYK
ncbi:MAG: 4Fe-4S binding protein [Desulfobacterales bacterium]|jgi:Pyruvate/2-oxoacid:ferredoxin oxidoreductase delta subunit